MTNANTNGTTAVMTGRERVRGIPDTIRESTESLWETSTNGGEPIDLGWRAEQAVKIQLAAAQLTPIQAHTGHLMGKCAKLQMGRARSGEDARTETERGSTNMLLSLEKLAFALGEDEWALAHGFQNPHGEHQEAGDRRAMGVALQIDRDITGDGYTGVVDTGRDGAIEVRGTSPSQVREKAARALMEALERGAVETMLPGRGWTETLIVGVNRKDAQNLLYSL